MQIENGRKRFLPPRIQPPLLVLALSSNRRFFPSTQVLNTGERERERQATTNKKATNTEDVGRWTEMFPGCLWQSGSRGFVDSEVFFWKMATVRLDDDYAPGRRADRCTRTRHRVDKIALGDDDYYIFHVSVFSFLEDITTILFQYNLRSDSSVLQVFWLIGTCSFGLSATTHSTFLPE